MKDRQKRLQKRLQRKLMDNLNQLKTKEKNHRKEVQMKTLLHLQKRTVTTPLPILVKHRRLLHLSKGRTPQRRTETQEHNPKEKHKPKENKPPMEHQKEIHKVNIQL